MRDTGQIDCLNTCQLWHVINKNWAEDLEKAQRKTVDQASGNVSHKGERLNSLGKNEDISQL